MNAPCPFKQSRAVLALASLGFALGAWLAPDTAIAQQRTGARTKPPATVTPRGSATARKPGDRRAVYGGSTCEWNGTSGAWSNPAKWSCGHVPGTQDEAFVSAGTVTLDTGMSVSRFVISGGTMEIASSASVVNEFVQEGGDINLRQDATLAFPQGHRFLQNAGTLMVEIGGSTRFGRMNFDNHIGGLGLFGLGGNLSIVGRNGFVPGDTDEFLFMNGSSMSAVGSGYTPQVSHTDFPVDFRPVLGLFSGTIKNIFPGACRWIGGYSVFGNPANWSCGRVPTASDTAILDAAQVELNGSFTVGRLVTRNYPRLFGFGNTLTALGQPQRNELTGPMDLNQNLVLALGDSFADNAQFSLYGQSVIENQGRFSASAGSLQFVSGASGVVHNAPGGTIDLKLNALFLYGGDIELLNEGEIVLNTPQQGSSIFTLEVQDGARIRQTQGRFVLNEVVGNYFEPPAAFQLEGGELVGNGRFDFPVNNVGGLVRPGMPASCGGGGEAFAASRASVAAFTTPSECSTPGYLEFLGYTQGPNGALELQLGSGGDDDFSVTGPANLAGKLSLRDLNGLRPEFDLNLFFGFPVTGTFDMFDSDFGPDYALQYRSNTVILEFLGTPPVRIAPLFTSAPAPSTGKVGVAYAHTFTASGTPAAAFFAGSVLPPGLALASNGELSGTPLRPGAYSFDVLADNGVEPFATQSITLDIALGDAAEIVATAGTSQSAVVGAAFGTRLRAVVRDFGGNAVPGVSVNFTAPASGASASLDPVTTISDANGEVSAAASATGGTGTYTVTASAPGVPGAATFDLTNVATAQGAIFGVTVPTVNYGQVFQFQVRAVDTTGNPLPSGRATVFVSGVEACSVELPDTRCEPQSPIEPGIRDVRAVLSAPLHTAPDFLSTIFIGAHAGSMVLDAPGGATVGTPLDVTATLKYLFDFEEIIPGTLPPTGVIEIKRSGVTVCSAPVSARDSSITCQLPVTTRTNFTLSAEYAGDVHYQPVSKSHAVIVAGAGEGFNVGDLVPDFTAHDHLGNPRTLREFAGKYVLLDFCAAWCGPCQTMGYDAGAVRATFAGKPFEYVTIVMQSPAITTSTIADAREWLSEHPVFGPVLHLNGDGSPTRDVEQVFSGLFPGESFPTLAILGPDQRLLHKSVGNRDFATVSGIVAQQMGIATPPIVPRVMTSGLTQAGVEVRVNGSLVLAAGPVRFAAESAQFSGNGISVAIRSAGIDEEPYDEFVRIDVSRAGEFTQGDVVDVKLTSVAWADGFARLPLRGTLNGNTFTLDSKTIGADDLAVLETGARFDLDFLNAGPAIGTPPIITSDAPTAAGQVGVSYQHQYTALGTPPIAFSLASGTLPAGLTLSSAGLLAGTPTSAGTFTGSVRATGAAAPEATQAFSIVIAPAAPVTVRVAVTKTGLGSGRVVSTPAGIDCGATCAADFVSGSLVQLAATADAGSRFDGWGGACSGTGSCAFSPASDASVNALFSLLPPPPVKPTFTSGAPAVGHVGIAYSHTFTASGTSPIAFSLGSGTLPAGLTLTNDGVLSGTPTAPGTFNATIAASNTAGSATQSVAITILAAARTHLEIAGGNHQVAFYNRARLTGDAFPAPLKVRVVDPTGAGLAGQRVEFVSLGLLNGAAPRADLSAQAVVTNANGEASVIATAANGAGPHQVRASVTGLEPVVFDLTNVIRAIGQDIALALPSTRSSGAGHRTPLLAPFHDDISVLLVSKLDARAPVPGREVRFYVPFDPNGNKPSAVLEGAGSGRLTSAESPRPDDGFYRLYATAISGTDSIASVKGFANNAAGSYDIIAVLVDEGDSVDPTLATAAHRLTLPMENLDTRLGVKLAPSTQQQAKAHEAYPQEIVASVFDSAIGPTAGIPGAEMWIFAGDDARGVPGATIVAADGIEGRLPGGERYTALTADIRGQARFTAVANRFQGKHDITIAYPGSYATLAEAKIKASAPFANTTGLPPGGGTGEGPAIASLEIVSGDFQRIASGSSASFAFPLVVRARDASGQPIANALVRFVPIATVVNSIRLPLRSSAILTDSSIVTDRNGLAQVGARPDGDGQSEFKVRASAEGAEPVYFTLRLTARGADSGIEITGVQRSGTRGGGGFIGQPQTQVILARFDEPLSVIAGSVAGRTRAVGQAVRFYYPGGAFDPEGGTPGTFVDSGGKPHPFVTLMTDGNGVASLRGIAGANAGAFDVVALLPDASPANDNDPGVVAARNDGRTFTFNLRNTAPGVTLTLEQGSFQGIETGQPFLRSLRVRAMPSNPDPGISHTAPGLDGADLWFMSPLVTDDRTPAAALLGGDVHTLVDSGGKAWRVVAVPIADDGLAETLAIANDVAGNHRIIAAYPGTFTDPASAKFAVTFFLCNGQPRSAPCQDPAVTPGTIELVDAGPLFTLNTAPPPLRVRVKNQLGAVMPNVSVGFFASGTGISGTSPYVLGGSQFSASFTTDANGIANGAAGLFVANASQEYTVLARAGTQEATLRFTRYAAATTIAPAGAIVSSALINTRHRALQVTTPNPAPIEWTVVPGAGGASALFAGGSLTARDIQPPLRPGVTTYTLPALTANGIAGTFTLKATVIGTTVTATFAMVNLATAPASVAPADSGPNYAYGLGEPPVRALVRDTNGQPLAGAEVTFTANGAFSYPSSTPWVRAASGSARTRVVTTGADGIANATGGISLLNSFSPEAIVAAVQGVTQTARIEVVRYNPPGTIRPIGAATSAVVVGTAHAQMVVELSPAIPARWTIVAAPNGAGGTFADGSTSLVRHPSITGPGTQQQAQVVRANAIAGTFTLRVQQLDGSGIPPVDFTLANLATAPASVAPADPAPRYAYGLGSPPIRAVVRDAAGQPLAGVPVTFNASGAFSYASSSPWIRSGSGSAATRVVTTGADGIADASGGISLLNAFSPEAIVAAVQGVTQTARIEVVRYNPPGTIRPIGATTSAVVVGTPHASMAVEVSPAIPVRWTIIAAANGAGGTFSDGTTSTIRFPSSTGPGTQQMPAVVRANGIAGTFTLRVQQLDGTGIPPVDFTLTNLASAPASVAPADPAPRYAYGLGEPKIRAVVRDAGGQPLAGVPVTFTATGAFSYPSSTPWVRTGSGSATARVVVSGADGIADATGGISLLNAYSPETILAAVQGVAQAARIEVVRFNPPSSMIAVGAASSIAAVDTNHASLSVDMAPQVPIRWTIIASSNGASGTFSDGTTTFVRLSSGTGVGRSSVVVRANGIPGVFTLRAQPADFPAFAPVDFTLTNLTALPASVERVDSGLLFSYTASAPPLRVIVRDANGAPIAGVPVKFEAEGDLSRIWERVGGLNVRTFTTDASGIADGSQFLTSSRTYVPNQVTASVPGVARTATMSWIHYLPLDEIDPVDGLVYSGPAGTQHIVRVRVNPPVPLRWTIVASPGGAGGRFLLGNTVQETVPTGTSGAAQTMQLAIQSNAVRGVYTVKVEAIGVDGPAVVIAVVNQ